jgi:hypothetical protein
MKLICKDITTIVVLTASIILFVFMVKAMTTSSVDSSSLPIGIVDCDNTDSSKDLIDGLQKVDTIRIIQKSEKELQALLADEMIYSYFTIENGYEEKLKSGDLKKLITMYYKQNNKSASILSDIVAGEIIYPESLYQGYRYYEKVPFAGKKLSLDEYKSYMNNLLKSSKDFNFAFHITYEDTDKHIITEKPLSNSVLYNQFIFGILGMLNAFVAMFIVAQTVKEKETGVDIRLKISGFPAFKRDLGILTALLLWEGFLSALFTGILFDELQSGNIKLWISTYFLMLLNSMVVGNVLLLVAKFTGKMITYQLVCSIAILLTGGLGYYHLLTGFYKGVTDNMLNFIPNSWFIKGITDIILYGREGGYLKEGHYILLIMAAVLFLLMIGLDLIMDIQIDYRKNHNRMVKTNG